MTDEETAAPRWLRILQALVLALGAVHAIFFTYAVVQRFHYPIELEWMSGGVLEHVDRVSRGEPIYVAPSASFIPFLYPPLYYWVSALFAKAMTVQAACRLVSVIATLVTAVLTHRAARKLGATPFWALCAPALFFGAYSLSGFWYDLERSDLLMMAMLTGGLVLALGRQALAPTAIAGALVGGAFFAKQPASIFFLAAIGGLVVAKSYRRAAAFAAGGLALLVPGVALLSAKTDGWFWFYCVKMPASHGIDPKLITVFFIGDAMKAFAIAGATTFALVVFGKQVVRALRAREALEDDDAIFGAMLAAAAFTSATSRLHVGGFLNVLIFWTTFGSIAFAVVGSRLAKLHRATEGVVVVAALLQLAHFLYDPGDAAPDERRVLDQKLVEDRIRELEKKGEVIVHGRGHLTVPRHYHSIALIDVMRGGLPIPADLVKGLEDRKYAAFVIDEFGELTLEGIVGKRSEFFDVVTRNYFIAQELDDRERPPLVGWIAHPSWILRPRQTPLTGATTAALDRRQKIEMGLAEMRMRAVQAGARKADDGDDVEAMAAAIDAEGTNASSRP
ncbi:MAG: hypothetical protein JWP87_441 [Labilithrix sp.]|nr:hypothetical protein [Labilithrix sp.]